MIVLLYTAKLSSGKTFAVVNKMHYSLEKFCGVSGHGHHVLYTASVQGESFRDWLKTAKTAKVFPLESFAVYGILSQCFVFYQNKY